MRRNLNEYFDSMQSECFFLFGQKDLDDTNATQSSSSKSLKDSCENFSMTHVTTPVQSPSPSILLIKSTKSSNTNCTPQKAVPCPSINALTNSKSPSPFPDRYLYTCSFSSISLSGLGIKSDRGLFVLVLLTVVNNVSLVVPVPFVHSVLLVLTSPNPRPNSLPSPKICNSPSLSCNA
jgi:hypothetical protein